PASGTSTVAKFTAWAVAAVVVGLGSYYLWQQSEEPAIQDESAVVTEDADVQAEEQTDLSTEATPDVLKSQEDEAAAIEADQTDELAADRAQTEQSVHDNRAETLQ